VVAIRAKVARGFHIVPTLWTVGVGGYCD
jgi:hypothetical protein